MWHLEATLSSSGIIWRTQQKSTRWSYIPNIKGQVLAVTDNSVPKQAYLKNMRPLPPPQWSLFMPQWNNYNKSGSGPQDDATYQILGLYHLV